MKRPDRVLYRRVCGRFAVRSLLALALVGCTLTACTDKPDGEISTGADPALDPTPETASSLADQVVQSEVVIEGLRVPLATLSKSVVNLSLPDARGLAVLAPAVAVVDLTRSPAEGREPVLDLGFQRGQWPTTGEAVTVPVEDLSLWEGFLDSVEFFHHFNFYNIRGEFRGPDLYYTDGGFKGLAQLKSGEIAAVEGKLGLDWQGRLEHVGDGEETVWRLAGFETRSFDFVEGREPLFADVGDLAFDHAPWRAAAHSSRDEATAALILDVRGGAVEMADYLEATRLNLATAGDAGMDTQQTAVVDIDGDGFDDLYVTGAGAPSVFFHNRGDGTFEERTAAVGLAFDHVYSVAFADFDNDGDPDAFLSRFNRANATRYLVNDGGVFVDKTDSLKLDLPNFVIPITVADVDNDGLLDVYLGRYVNAFLPAMMLANEQVLAETGSYRDQIPFMDDATAHEVLRANRESGHALSHVYGPPNWLLLNRGGGSFERAGIGGDVEGDFNTLAVAWTDMDQDGDMDAYLVSEGGPNELKMNNGDGTFTEVATGDSAEIGFGMGAGVGDYDNDGRSDIYTTNMYSKAGLRVSEQMGSSEIVVQSARGNTLMRNTSSGFVRVSSLDDSGIQVEAADFGWGGAFADLNNDAFLDLYVPAGQQSVPQEVATIGDS